MWMEFGTIVLTTVLSFTGVGLPQLNTSAISSTAVDCAARTADSCQVSDECALFVEASGEEVCAVSCEMHSLESCSMDSHCAVVDGVCDYAEDAPPAC